MRNTFTRAFLAAAILLMARLALAEQIFKPGLRLTYYLGSAQLPGESKTWQPDPNGAWVDPNTGQKWSHEDQVGGGGYGLLQFNVVGVDDQFVAIETRGYQISDPQRNTFVLGSLNGGVAKRGARIDELWIDPQELANSQEDRNGNPRIARMDYPLGGKTWKAIRFQYQKPDGFWAQSTYDTETGLLLVTSSQTVGKPPLVSGANGTLQQGKGTATITISYFISARQLKLPWADAGAPKWLNEVKAMSFAGGVQMELAGSQFQTPPTPMTDEIAIQPAGSMAMFKERIVQGQVADITNTTERMRASGSGGIGQLWLPPANLQANQVIDEDPHTGVRTIVEQVGQSIIITETGPTQMMRYMYDANSRMLVGAQNMIQMPTGNTTSTLQLQGAR